MFQPLKLRKEDVLRQEEALRVRVAKLDAPQRKLYYGRASKLIRDPDTFAALNYFFITGLHHFYLKRFVTALTELGLLILGILLWIKGWPGYILIAFVVVVETMAMFRAETVVMDFNNEVSEGILAELEVEPPAAPPTGNVQ